MYLSPRLICQKILNSTNCIKYKYKYKLHFYLIADNIQVSENITFNPGFSIFFKFLLLGYY